VFDPEHVDAEWSRPSERLYTPPFPDGVTHFTVDRSADSFLLWFDGFGRYVVSADGATVGCERDSASRDHQERFLFAQALPLAAALQGFELLHAGAVCVEGQAAAFAGAAGVGKTSLVTRLVARGAAFVTDDRLALQRGSDALIAHPGPPLVAVGDEDSALLDLAARLGPEIGHSEKTHFLIETVARPLPLLKLYYLEPGPGLAIEPLDAGDARAALGSGAVPYVTGRERLERHLEIAQLLEASVSQYRLEVPRTGSFDAVLEAIEADLGAAVS
jgi:hypothetical protein